jgi:hypothetical protein
MNGNGRRHERQISTIAKDLGYIFDGKTSRGHLRWRNPRGTLVIVGRNLGQANSFRNAVATLRQNRSAENKRGATP